MGVLILLLGAKLVRGSHFSTQGQPHVGSGKNFPSGLVGTAWGLLCCVVRYCQYMLKGSLAEGHILPVTQ